MDKGTKICWGSILSLVALILFIIYPFQMFILTLTVLGVILFSKIYDWRQRKKSLANKIHSQLTAMEGVVKKNKDAKLKLLFSETVKKYNKSKFNDASALIKKFESIWKKKVERQEEELKKRVKEAERLKRLKFEKEQKTKGLVKFTDYQGNEKWGTKRQVEKWKKEDNKKREIEVGLDKNFMHLSGYEFEEFVSELFNRMGYKTQLTPKTGDYGIDVIAKGDGDIIAIQCKRFSEGQNVSNRDVQRARGSMDYYDANKCIIVTNQDFTIQAKEQAGRTKNMELWNKRILHDMVRRYFIENEIKT